MYLHCVCFPTGCLTICKYGGIEPVEYICGEREPEYVVLYRNGLTFNERLSSASVHTNLGAVWSKYLVVLEYFVLSREGTLSKTGH